MAKPTLRRAVPKDKIRAGDYNFNFDQLNGYIQTGIANNAINNYDGEQAYKKGAWVLGDVDGKKDIYESQCDENKGNSLKDTRYWKKVNLGAYIPLLTPFFVDHIIDCVQYLRADTFSWQDGNTYISVYEKLEQEYATGTTEEISGITFKRTTSGFKIADVSQEQAILELYNSSGIAWYYILDTTNKRFKLPRTKFGFEGLRTNVGDNINAGLPNITGRFYGQNRESGSDGCFYSVNGAYQNAVNKNNDGNMVVLDASRSSSIYGSSSTVQPPATQMYLYFYVGEYTQTAIEQTAGLNTELFNNKLDLNASNLDTEGKSYLTSLPLPSNKYTTLNIGASGSTYTAPANGWFACDFGLKQTSASGIMWGKMTNKSTGYAGDLRFFTGGTEFEYMAMLPVKKGDVIVISYLASSVYVASWEYGLRFVYAEGVKE